MLIYYILKHTTTSSNTLKLSM